MTDLAFSSRRVSSSTVGHTFLFLLSAEESPISSDWAVSVEEEEEEEDGAVVAVVTSTPSSPSVHSSLTKLTRLLRLFTLSKPTRLKGEKEA